MQREERTLQCYSGCDPLLFHRRAVWGHVMAHDISRQGLAWGPFREPRNHSLFSFKKSKRIFQRSEDEEESKLSFWLCSSRFILVLSTNLVQWRFFPLFSLLNLQFRSWREGRGWGDDSSVWCEGFTLPACPSDPRSLGCQFLFPRMVAAAGTLPV